MIGLRHANICGDDVQEMHESQQGKGNELTGAVQMLVRLVPLAHVFLDVK